MPTILQLLLQSIPAIIQAAPKIAEISGKLKDFVMVLFSAKMITKAQQDAINDHIDAQNAMKDAGIVLPHWTIEGDPVSAPGVVVTTTEKTVVTAPTEPLT